MIVLFSAYMFRPKISKFYFVPRNTFTIGLQGVCCELRRTKYGSLKGNSYCIFTKDTPHTFTIVSLHLKDADKEFLGLKPILTGKNLSFNQIIFQIIFWMNSSFQIHIYVHYMNTIGLHWRSILHADCAIGKNLNISATWHSRRSYR